MTAEASGPVAGKQPPAPPAASSEASAVSASAASSPEPASSSPSSPSSPAADAPAPSARKSRRFPLITRDTARPEGGGRAAPGSAPAPARQWPLLTVMGGVALGLLIVALDAFRAGTVLIGLALLAGAVLRWALPEVGMLAVRSRFTDMLTYGVLGAVIVLLSLMVQPDPWVEIPFLEDVVHFTVR
ncbi:DUF3017 domain-containing protein [Streptomyces sp. NPDC005322]|uniref:DUF3017 domain-containing protein n=1 Tax=unclassified Streptomyces TaxID=2593676 RepID=UPI0033AF643C